MKRLVVLIEDSDFEDLRFLAYTGKKKYSEVVRELIRETRKKVDKEKK